VSERELDSQRVYRPGLLAVVAVTFGGLAILVFFLAELGLVPLPNDGRLGLVLIALVAVGFLAELVIAHRSRNNPRDDD
jgi:Zn-dependent protease with chaperone function